MALSASPGHIAEVTSKAARDKQTPQELCKASVFFTLLTVHWVKCHFSGPEPEWTDGNVTEKLGSLSSSTKDSQGEMYGFYGTYLFSQMS